MADGTVIYEIKGDNSGFQKSVGETEKIASGGWEKIQSAGKVAFAAIGAAVVAVGAAMVSVGKQGIAAFAEYEQVSGGAKLVWGEAYDYIAAKAATAYADVQMSTTDYLTQVNGLAVGLKESMGGSEQAAAELANKIITAEADVVAAMGISQDAAQNAFNGIMRGNYTMLDNLGVGIKGTKEGMQEVIDKVNEWHEANGRATRYNMDNLADQQAALVDYIEMVGLSGYAHAEAADTISGSLASTQAAWQNLLAGMGDAEADFDTLLDNFMSSVENLAKNVSPVIENMLPRLVSAFSTLTSNFLPQAISMITAMLPSFTQAAVDIIQALANALIANASTLLKCGFDLILNLVSGIGQNLPQLLPAAVDAVVEFADYVANNADKVADCAVELMTGLATGLIQAIPHLVAAVPEIVSALLSALLRELDNMLGITGDYIVSGLDAVSAEAQYMAGIGGEDTGKSFGDGAIAGVGRKGDEVTNAWANVTGIAGSKADFLAGEYGVKTGTTFDDKTASSVKSGSGKVSGAATGMVNSAISSGKSSAAGASAIGAQIGAGVERGIKGYVQRVASAAANLVSQALAAAKARAAIASPSKVFKEEVGEMISLGVADGIEAYSPFVRDKMKSALGMTLSVAKDKAHDFEEIGRVILENVQNGLDAGKDELYALAESYVMELYDVVKNENGEYEGDYADVAKKTMEAFGKGMEAGYGVVYDALQDELNTITSEYTQKYNEVIKARDDLEKRLSSAGDTFRFYTEKSGYMYAVTGDLDYQIEKMQEYSDAITMLSEREIPEGLWNQILEMDMDKGTAAAKRLLAMTDTQFEAFIAKWQQKQELARQIASKTYQDKLDALDVEFKQKAEELFETVEGDFYNIGVDTMQGWMEGMESQLPKLEATVRRIARNVIAETKKTLAVASPSKVFAEIGEFVDQGLAVGIEDATEIPVKSTTRMVHDVINTAFEFPSLQSLTGAISVPTAGERTIYIYNTLTGTMEADGFTLANIVLRNLDDAAAFTLRG